VFGVLGVVLQAVVVTAGAVVIGGAIALALREVIPDAIPVRFEVSRLVVSALLVVITGALGAGVSVRRIVRVDPATAIS
jgi:putative ABC transport system permease protein